MFFDGLTVGPISRALPADSASHLERIAAFVLLSHAIDDEHDEQDGHEQADDRTADNGCKSQTSPFFHFLQNLFTFSTVLFSLSNTLPASLHLNYRITTLVCARVKSHLSVSCLR